MPLDEFSPELLRIYILDTINTLSSVSEKDSKEDFKKLHKPSVQYHLALHHDWIEANISKYLELFANGEDIDPSRIAPEIIEVTESWHKDLFRLARLTWSLPYSRGYGRRLRFLVMDRSNGKLIGVIGLQSPPLDFPPRDRLFRYPEGAKVEYVNQTMDVFTLGAVPPYNRLLGGKLVALASASDEVRVAYQVRYTGKATEMEKRTLPPHLVALTTTSAFGRSSLYDRLKYQDRLIAESIGYTEGYGSFHLAPLYPMLCAFLKQQGVVPKSGFGVGPRAVWQTCRIAFRLLKIPSDSLRHGIKREAFMFPLVSNLQEYMEGLTSNPIYFRQPFDELANWWKHRWLLPRSARINGWHSWDRESIRKVILAEATE
jgi:hypothetical protein